MVTGRSFGGRAAISWPLTRMLPDSARSKPAISDSSVLLPAPLGPITPRNSPLSTCRSNSICMSS